MKSPSCVLCICCERERGEERKGRERKREIQNHQRMRNGLEICRQLGEKDVECII